MQVLLTIVNIIVILLFFSLVFNAKYLLINGSDFFSKVVFACISGIIVAQGLSEISNANQTYIIIFGVVGAILSVLLVTLFRWLVRILARIS